CDETAEATLAGDAQEFDYNEYGDEEFPERIGRYLVLDRLGAGGMGVVYAAYDPDLDRKLALKLLHEGDRRSERTRVRLLREAQALARVSHPNVIQVYDVGTFEDRIYIAMEFVDGLSLREWLSAENRDLRAILATFSQAGHGLAAAHQKGLVHRDFKPDNVLVARDGRVVVLDFGIAHAIGDLENEHERSGITEARLSETRSGERSSSLQGTGPLALHAELTRAGALIGTPAYMAPEQFDSRDTDARSDQFSFCVTLWEALHGERP
ncbi:MAG: serine/threonine protein kinase, partial [Myxococcales bacterium]|nr:serine/threonine protein kinase [Myxococcales bacterium]